MKITNIELQYIPSNVEHMHMVAVMGSAGDGWRVYEAAVQMPPYDSDNPEIWEGAKQWAASFAAAHGNKLSKQQARKYFIFPDDFVFAP